MNKTLPWVIAGVAVLGALVLYFTMGKAPSQPSPAANQPTTTGQTSGETGHSMKELLAAGVAQQCTFSDTTNNVTTQGTVYVGTGRLRADSTTTDTLHTTVSHTIVLDNRAYVWVDGMPTGFMMSLTGTTQAPPSQPGVSADKKINYQCSGWLVDQSKFNLPSSVEFMSAGAAAPQGTMPTRNPGSTGGIQGGVGY